MVVVGVPMASKYTTVFWAYDSAQSLPQCHIVLSESQCVHELEKTQLLLKECEQENALLKKKIEELEGIIRLLKEMRRDG